MMKRIWAVLPVCILPVAVSAAVEPREQTLEIVNRCTHDVDVRAKQRLFRRPWKAVPRRFSLESGGRLKTREWRYVRLFWINDEMSPPPEISFRFGEEKIPFETVKGNVPENRRWKCEMYRIVACPENMTAEEGQLEVGEGHGGCGIR
ncbi:MAG: hypothetical protein Q3966_07280 [Neisseria sp.]|nr:hypothetical protein [Neisseria sp.]